MSKLEKAKERIRKIPADYTFGEADALLSQLGFKCYNKGKTSGSRIKFYREKDSRIIMLHKPHPSDTMCQAAVRDIVRTLERTGDL